MKKQTEKIVLKIMLYLWFCVMCFILINAALSFVFLDIEQTFSILALLVISEFTLQLQINLNILDKMGKSE